MLRPSQHGMWDVCAEKVIGSTHTRQGRNCQDDCRYEQSAMVTVLALADGHGSEKCPKSEFGAEIATRCAVEQLRAFAEAVAETPLDRIQQYAQETLPRQIVKMWIDKVLWREMVRQPDPGETAKILLEYGTTLLAVLATPRYVLYLQLGDGDILRVGQDHGVTRPIPKNPAHFANETTSLSMVDPRTGQPNGWLEMTIAFEPLPEPTNAPALIVASTDGYANSFTSDTEFTRVGSDVLEMIQAQGWPAVKRALPEWLKDATKQGSGDDIALGLLWNTYRPSKQGE